MNRATRKAGRRARRQNNLISYAIIAGVSLIVVIIVILMVQSGAPPSAADTTTVGLMGTPFANLSRDHIPTDQAPTGYNNPPAGGAHYPATLPAKFYLESDVATLPPHPEGYLTHNLEHGYVIFWYDCDITTVDCNTLQQTIQRVMNAVGTTKLIAFPWHHLTVPLAMSTWGQVMYFPTLDENAMQQFVLHNRYQAPEPDAQ